MAKSKTGGKNKKKSEDGSKKEVTASSKKKGDKKDSGKSVSKKTKKDAKPDGPGVKKMVKQLAGLERKLEMMEKQLKELKVNNRDLKKRLNSAESKLETRIRREEILMAALKINTRTKKGDPGKMLSELNSGLLKTEEYLLHTGKRIDNLLNAVKNHREYLVKLNTKVNKISAREKIEMELDIMSNTLSILMLNGFDFDKSLLKDIERARKEMEKEDAKIGNLKKRMASLDRKFEEELERFDFASIYSKKKEIPGYG